MAVWGKISRRINITVNKFLPVERPVVQETTALGAAYLAGLAVGYWDHQAEIAAQWNIDHTFKPEMSKEKMEDLYGGWKKAIKAAMVFK
jgi:glycerol kinase